MELFLPILIDWPFKNHQPYSLDNKSESFMDLVVEGVILDMSDIWWIKLKWLALKSVWSAFIDEVDSFKSRP